MLSTQTDVRAGQYDKPPVAVSFQAEIEVVKGGMQHGDLSLDAYTQVLGEVLGQV